jgi:hypothetical protein
MNLGFLNLSAAFDIFNQLMPQELVSTDFDINEQALSRLQSVITKLASYVAVNAARSATAQCTLDILKGSVSVPLRIAIYVSSLGNIVASPSLCYYRYAGDK